VSVEVPEVVIDAGLRLVVNPFGAVAESETVPVKVLRAFMVIVEVPEDPLLIVRDVGEAEIEKSGVVTCTVTVVLWLSVTLVPVTVTEYVPVELLLGTVIVRVEVPVVREDVLRVAIQPFGVAVERATVSVNPFNDVRVMVVVPVLPLLMVIGFGDAEIEKSGVV
jgi:hypothetical protein